MEWYAVVVADIDGVVRQWTAAAEELFGYPAETVVGRTLDMIIPEDHREAHWAAFRALMSSATAGDPADRGAVILPVRRQDGSSQPAAVRLMLLRDAWNRPVGAAAVFASPGAAPDGAQALPEL